MIRLADHIIIAPVVLPLFAGAVMLALGGERHRNVNAAINVVTSLALVAISIALRSADAGTGGLAGAVEGNAVLDLDGVSIVSNLVSTTTLRPSVDTISEFQIQTGTYSAQYGTWLGVHLNVISKNGTNELHGAAWEFLRNNVLDARNFFASPTIPKPPFRQNQFGGRLDGPFIIPKVYNGRNRTFFMVNYEGQRQTQASPR